MRRCAKDHCWKFQLGCDSKTHHVHDDDDTKADHPPLVAAVAERDAVEYGELEEVPQLHAARGGVLDNVAAYVSATYQAVSTWNQTPVRNVYVV